MEYLEFDEASYLICDLYASKCEALRIDNTEQLRLRFVHSVQDKLSRGELDLSNEKLAKTCAPAIVALIRHLGEQIHSVKLDDNPLEDVGIIALNHCQPQLNGLTDLSLASVGLSPDGFIDFFQNFPDDCKLESLNLGSNPSAEKRNRFNEESCTYLAQFVCRCKNLSRLSFINTQLRGLNGYSLFKNITSECSLRHINLANTGVSNSAIRQLCTENARFMPFIEFLDISGNETLNSDCCVDIGNLVLYERHFHELFISDCCFDDAIKEIFLAIGHGSAEELAAEEAFKRRNAVREAERTSELCALHFGIKNLVETGKVIASEDELEKKPEIEVKEGEELERTCALFTLDFSNCKISALNLEALANSLKLNQSLRTLRMDNCGIDLNRLDIEENLEFKAPFDAFCAALAEHPSITHLSLGKNSILDAGAQNFAAILQVPTLRTFSVSYCRIGNDGIVTIAKGLGQAKSLEKLLIAGNNCDDVAGQALFANLQNYTRLKVLDISLNKISFEFSEKLQTLIKQNIEESCSEVYQSLMQRVNLLEAQLNELNFVDVETVKYRTECNDLKLKLEKAAEDMVETHAECEENLEKEYAVLDDLRKEEIDKDAELAQETIKVNEMQTRIDQETAICEQKKRIIRDKTTTITHEIEALEEAQEQEEEDGELLELEKKLDRKLKESKVLEKECVDVLSQLAACEGILVKEGIVQIAQPRKTRK